MRENLGIALAAVAVTILAVALSAFVKTRQPLPPEVTPRMLAADPDYFTNGSLVRIRTGGMEAVGGELRFREASDLPYVVVCRFAGKLPEPIPPVVVGTYRGKQGEVVAVENCRP